MRTYTVLSPDQLPIRPRPFTSEAEARSALLVWCMRFAAQGYYAGVDGRIELNDLPGRCSIAYGRSRP